MTLERDNNYGKGSLIRTMHTRSENMSNVIPFTGCVLREIFFLFVKLLSHTYNNNHTE